MKAKVYIAIPSARDWKVQFGTSICGLVHKTAAHGIEGVELEGFNMNVMQGASVLPRARQLAIDHAIKEDYSHILFLDDDMRFPADLLDDLFRHDSDIVGINYIKKVPGTSEPQTCGLDGKFLSSKGKTGGEEVAWIGFGAVLINLDAVKNITAPQFEMRWMEERKDFIGEDFYFCGKVRRHGLKIYVDHDASNKAAHIGDFPYREAA
jgi:GT2 family glycosyltransferase